MKHGIIQIVVTKRVHLFHSLMKKKTTKFENIKISFGRDLWWRLNFVINVYKISQEYQVKLKQLTLLQEKSFKTNSRRRIFSFQQKSHQYNSSSYGKRLQLHFQINCRVLIENRFINRNNECPVCRNKCKLLNINNHIECKKQNVEYHNCIIRGLRKEMKSEQEKHHLRKIKRQRKSRTVSVPTVSV